MKRSQLKTYSPLKRTRFERKSTWKSRGYSWGRSRLRAKPDRKLAAWSKAVRERDGNVCQWPGGYQTGDTRIDAHHKAKRSQRPDLRLSLSNGVSLCRTHHELTDTDKAGAVANGMLRLDTYEAARKAA